jgi:hypothetical protein
MMAQLKGVSVLFQTAQEQIEEIEDRAFEGCIMRFVKDRNIAAAHALLNDYGLVLEMRDREKDKTNA